MNCTRHRPAGHKPRLVAIWLAFVLVAAACGGSDGDGGGGTAASTTDGTADAGGGGAADSDTPDEPEPDEATVETIEDEASDTGPVRGGTLRYAVTAEADGLNPTTSAFSPAGATMANAVFDTLVALDADGQTLHPFLAESFEPSDDFLTWTFTLRPGILFHDGTPLNADAIVENFNRQLADLLVGLAVNPFFVGVDEKITKIDDLTVQFNLGIANAFFPSGLTSQLGMVASPTWLADADEDPTLNQAPVGTGPFVIDTRTPDSVTRFVRNDNYWGAEVLLDAVEFLPVPDTDTRIDLFLSGEVDGFMANDSGAVQETRDNDDFEIVLDDTGEESFVMINSAEAPFDDIRVRQALTFSTARENYSELIGLGVRRPADQMFNPESRFYNPDVVQEGDDSAAALPLIESYCAENADAENTVLGGPVCTDGKVNFELQYSGPSVIQDRIAEILTAGWSDGGFNVTFQILPQDDHIQETAFGLFNVNTWRQFGTGDPASDNVWLWCQGVGGISLNWPRFCDPARDEILFEAMATTDDARRIELYQELSSKVQADYLYVFLLRALWLNAYQAEVNGVCERLSPDGDPLYCSLNGRTWFGSAWIGE